MLSREGASSGGGRSDGSDCSWEVEVEGDADADGFEVLARPGGGGSRAKTPIAGGLIMLAECV